MIIDKIENANLYAGLSERMATAFSFLTTTDLNTLAIGKHAVDGDNVIAIMQEYNSKDINDCKPETHFEHIDIQYIVEGVEQIGVSTRTSQLPASENREKDVAFYKLDCTLHPFEQGTFGVFFPDDIHQPGIELNESCKVRKVVMKIRVQ